MTDTGLEHVLLALVAAIPATIAALSSLRNGREQKRVKDELSATNHHLIAIKKKLRMNNDGMTASDPDWYKAPELWS